MCTSEMAMHLRHMREPGIAAVIGADEHFLGFDSDIIGRSA